MNKMILMVSVAVFMTNISASYAEKCLGSTGKTEITEVECKTCGDNCDWEIVDGKLSITGTGAMYSWSEADNIPWYGKPITSVEFGSGITSIGKHAFLHTPLTSITIPDTITSVKGEAFCTSTGHLTELIIPDSWADGNVILGSLFNKTCFATPFADNRPSCTDAKIVCQGDVEKCKKALAKFDKNGNCTLTYCIDANKIIAANYQQCSGSYFWNGAGCVREPDVSKRKCCSSCKDMGGWCNRIRYTPAEAAKVLKNDNTNEVTITFKK